jgi:hypothetical protein
MKQRQIGWVKARFREVRLAGMDPVPVATEGVDFSVVSHHSERVSEGPRGEGVCAVALMKNGERSFVGGVLKI